MVFPGGSDGKESTCTAGDLSSIPGLGRSPGGGRDNPTTVFLPGESHGQKSLVVYSPWDYKWSDMAERPLKKKWLAENSRKRIASGGGGVLAEPGPSKSDQRGRPQEQRGGSSHLLPCLFPCYCHSRSPRGPLGSNRTDLCLHCWRSVWTAPEALGRTCGIETTSECPCMCACKVASVMSDSVRPYGLWPSRLLCPWNFPGKNTEVGYHALLHVIFPNQR